MQWQTSQEAAMPNGIYPVPIFDRRSQPMTLRVRLKTWWRRRRYDERLAAGDDPASSGELSLRAAQLRSPARRIRLASFLDHVVSEAFSERPGFTTQAPVRRADVRSCADELSALARRLRERPAVNVRGVAIASQLLNDGTSPLYTETGPSALRDVVHSALLALDPEQATETALSLPPAKAERGLARMVERAG
jgi:hypothetical protein